LVNVTRGGVRETEQLPVPVTLEEAERARHPARTRAREKFSLAQRYDSPDFSNLSKRFKRGSRPPRHWLGIISQEG